MADNIPNAPETPDVRMNEFFTWLWRKCTRLPSLVGAAGKILISDGTNWVASTPSYPNASVTAGKVIRSDGTNYAASTFTIPDTYAQGDMLYGSASNVLSALAKDSNSVRYLANTGTSNNPAWFNPFILSQQGLYNIAFAQGSDSSQLKITSAQGATLSSTNFGKVVIRSSTAGTYREFTVTADVTLDLTGCHWGLDGKGDVTGAILRVYAIDDNGTLRWGVGYQGGFYYIRNTQDDTTASNINLPEEIFTNGNVSTDNSPMRDVGWIKANFTDSTNEWAITEYHPNESADGIWQPWAKTWSGFSSNPTDTSSWMSIGKTVFLKSLLSANGTSNATTLSVTGPIKANARNRGIGQAINNGLYLTQPGLIEGNNSSVTINCFTDYSGAAWAAANGKSITFDSFYYEAYQP